MGAGGGALVGGVEWPRSGPDAWETPEINNGHHVPALSYRGFMLVMLVGLGELL